MHLYMYITVTSQEEIIITFNFQVKFVKLFTLLLLLLPVCICSHMQAWRYAFTTLTTVVATVIVEKLKAREKHLLNFSFSWKFTTCTVAIINEVYFRSPFKRLIKTAFSAAEFIFLVFWSYKREKEKKRLSEIYFCLFYPRLQHLQHIKPQIIKSGKRHVFRSTAPLRYRYKIC